ncbi:unnamed protein product [Zymoseptoria tritici ST99CH_1A5]|uniref:Uncharacterized protein n=1 Tax=Zymoseptoria tritici ST99CH_1A5 TaxID=1276529 RepID=A0A1Y6LQS9_ZYMTR|nr:unnamed protein product [Zymoseptoria tritici ST99CH_1A5]
MEDGVEEDQPAESDGEENEPEDEQLLKKRRKPISPRQVVESNADEDAVDNGSDDGNGEPEEIVVAKVRAASLFCRPKRYPKQRLMQLKVLKDLLLQKRKSSKGTLRSTISRKTIDEITGREPGAAAEAREQDPTDPKGNSGLENARGGPDLPGSDREGLDPPENARGGLDPPGSDRAGSDPPGGDRGGPDPPGSTRGTSDVLENTRERLDPPGSNRGGPDPPVSTRGTSDVPENTRERPDPPGSDRGGLDPPVSTGGTSDVPENTGERPDPPRSDRGGLDPPVSTGGTPDS